MRRLFCPRRGLFFLSTYDTPSGLAVSSQSQEHAYLVYNTYRGLGRLVSPAASALPGSLAAHAAGRAAWLFSSCFNRVLLNMCRPWLLRKRQQRFGRRNFLLRRSNPFGSVCLNTLLRARPPKGCCVPPPGDENPISSRQIVCFSSLLRRRLLGSGAQPTLPPAPSLSPPPIDCQI